MEPPLPNRQLVSRVPQPFVKPVAGARVTGNIWSGLMPPDQPVKAKGAEVPALAPHKVPAVLRSVNEKWPLTIVARIVQWWTEPREAPAAIPPPEVASRVGAILKAVAQEPNAAALVDACESVMAAQEDDDILKALHLLEAEPRIHDPRTENLYREMHGQYEKFVWRHMPGYGALATLSDVGHRMLETVPVHELARQVEAVFSKGSSETIGSHDDSRTLATHFAEMALSERGIALNERVFVDGSAAVVAMWLGLAARVSDENVEVHPDLAIWDCVQKVWEYPLRPYASRPRDGEPHNFYSLYQRSYEAFFEKERPRNVAWPVPRILTDDWEVFRSRLQFALETHPDLTQVMLLSKAWASFMDGPEIFEFAVDPTRAFIQRIEMAAVAANIGGLALPADLAITLPRAGHPSAKNKMFGPQLQTLFEPMATSAQGESLREAVHCLLNPMRTDKHPKRAVYRIKLMRSLLDRFAGVNATFRSRILEPIYNISNSRGTAP